MSTDPPYYDNIGYSTLRLLLLWQRRSLRPVYPSLLDAARAWAENSCQPYRHDGKDGAKQFFEDGFRQVFARARATALPDFPITVYYA